MSQSSSSHQLSAAQEIFVSTQNDRLAQVTWDNYKSVYAKFQQWIKSISEYKLVCFENDKFLLKNVTLAMLTTYYGDNKYHKKTCGKRKVGDLYSESHAFKIHASIKAEYSKANINLPDGYDAVNCLLYTVLLIYLQYCLFRQAFGKYMSGFERNVAKARHRGELPSEASDRLPVSGYIDLSILAIQSETRYVHAILIFGWNLFSRCGNTISIKTGNN